MGHDPYGSQGSGNGFHHGRFHTLEILRCVPRMQVAADESLLSFYGYMMQDVAISESLAISRLSTQDASECNMVFL